MPPTYVIGDLWDEIGKADVLLVATHSSLHKDHALVMDTGVARAARERYPFLPYRLGTVIHILHTKLYGVALWTEMTDQNTLIGAFQVRYDWHDDILLEVVAYSAGYLSGIAWDYQRIALNFPATDHGRVSRDMVTPFLAPLPSHIFIYGEEECRTHVAEAPKSAAHRCCTCAVRQGARARGDAHWKP